MTRPPRILIVDDERMIVDYLEEYLQRLGYETATAANGREALEKVAVDSPDLILLDIVMPVIDGLKVCRILKGDEVTRLIPIVIMTSLDGIEDRIKGIEAGADDYLAKPINPRELTARIETALRLKRNVDLKISELHRIKDHFAKFVPEAVKRLVSANPEAPELAKRERDLSVLFLDISGYADLSERLPPQALNTLVERYFSTFLDRIQEAGGDINETAGDGFMAIFQDADPDAHAATTTETALALLAATQALNRENSEHPLSVHMGINSGTALVGSTRFEGARGTRWTFTASGPVTNLAARLAAAAGPGQVLAGPETVRRLGDRYRIERLGSQHLKNILEDVEVHRVLNPS
ncbi:MAG: response regulator [Candidatus Rokuibacteriota bacterium]